MVFTPRFESIEIGAELQSIELYCELGSDSLKGASCGQRSIKKNRFIQCVVRSSKLIQVLLSRISSTALCGIKSRELVSLRLESFRTHTVVVSALDYLGGIIALIIGLPLLCGSDRRYITWISLSQSLQATLAGVTPFSYSIYGLCAFNLTQVCIITVVTIAFGIGIKYSKYQTQSLQQ